MDTGKTSILLSPPPHQGTPEQVRGIYFDLLLALAPAALIGIISYGFRALLAMALCAACGVGICIVLGILTRRRAGLDACVYTAYVCLLCVFGFGAGCALWVCALAGVFCALFVFALGSASGRGIFHPAIAAFLLCSLLFASQTGAYIAPLDGFNGFFSLSTKTISPCDSPAALLAQGETLSHASLLVGGTAGAIGSSGALALLVGGAYLILRRIGNLRAPLTACAVMFVLALLFPAGQPRLGYAAAQLLCGGFLTGAMFFLFPVAGAPVSRRGQLLFAAGYSALCFAIRRLSGADGAFPALVLMQAFAWSFDFSRVLARVSTIRFGAYLETLLLRGTKGRRETARVPVSPRPEPVAARQPEEAEEMPEEELLQEDLPEADTEMAEEMPQAVDFDPQQTAQDVQNPEMDGADDGNERI